MIADDEWSPLETAVQIIAAPAWVPVYFAWVGCRKAAEAWSRRKPKPVEPEILLRCSRSGCRRRNSSARYMRP